HVAGPEQHRLRPALRVAPLPGLLRLDRRRRFVWPRVEDDALDLAITRPERQEARPEADTLLPREISEPVDRRPPRPLIQPLRSESGRPHSSRLITQASSGPITARRPSPRWLFINPIPHR